MKIHVIGLLRADFDRARRQLPGVDLELVDIDKGYARQRAQLLSASRIVVNTRFLSHTVMHGVPSEKVTRCTGGTSAVVRAVLDVIGAGTSSTGTPSRTAKPG